MTTVNKTTLWSHAAGLRGLYYKSLDCFQHSKKSLLKSSHPKKKYLPIFPTPKNPRIKNFKPKMILRSPPTLEYPLRVSPVCKYYFVKIILAYTSIALKTNNIKKA